MAQERRSRIADKDVKVGTGIMLAKVVSYVDPEFMGGLEVTLITDSGNTIGANQETYSVKYATPFYGVTGYEYMGLNKADFTDTQKSYGMWFPTPEIGTTVLVAFVDGDPSRGYYIACVPGRFMNHMIPAIGASSDVELTEEDKELFDTDQPLPVGEVNRKVNTLEKSLEIDKIKKPVHPIANRFLEQGLLEDDVRGPAQSTSRRNVPNAVFGISTPGPTDRAPEGKRQFIGKKETRTTGTVPVGRTGGTQFVMDDGNDRFRRATPASLGPIDYVDTLEPSETRRGISDIPYGEHVRLRTRTGHQILLHNSEDLIYIGNARGTTWIELTSNGKIDIYAEDSISIHTQADFNFRADRDVNIEAGRNINMRTARGRFHADVNGNLELAVSGTSLITTLADLNLRTTGNTKMSSGGNLDISTTGANKISSSGEFDLAAGGTLKVTSTGNIVAIKGVHIFATGGQIHLNGPEAPGADFAAEASSARPLSLYDNPATSSLEKWQDKNRYRTSELLKSIMRRIPMHEPWPLHENFRPDVFDKEFTDRDPLPTEPSEEILRKTIEDAESPIGGVDTVDEEVGGDRTTIDEEIPEGPPPPALPPTPDEQRAKLDAEIAALEEDLSIALRDEFVVLRSKQNLARLQRGNTDPFKDTKTYLALSEEIANLGLQIDDTLARVEQLKERLADLNARKAAIK